MGTSTNTQICYGIPFEEDFEFPWGEQELDDWWLDDVLGYKPPFQLYDDQGNYLDGHRPSDDKVNEYYAHRREFLAEHPLPITLVNYCSGDYPMWIIAIADSIVTAHRGEPIDITDSLFEAKYFNHSASLLEFCVEHGIETTEEPRWLLSSYWG